MSTSSIPDVKTSFSRLDLAAAKVVVKRLVQAGVRKGPTEFLVLSDSQVNDWLNEEAERYLREQQVRQQQPVAVIP